MPRALWTPQAAQELDDILFYVSVRDGRPQTGESIYFEIRQLADDYALSSAARHLHPLAPPGWYYFLHKRWIAFYQLHADGIEVMRVIDGTRSADTNSVAQRDAFRPRRVQIRSLTLQSTAIKIAVRLAAARRKIPFCPLRPELASPLDAKHCARPRPTGHQHDPHALDGRRASR